MDGLKSAHPRPPVPPEQVEDAVAVFGEQLMDIELHWLDVEEEMQQGTAPSSDSRFDVPSKDRVEGTAPCAPKIEESLHEAAGEDGDVSETVADKAVIDADDDHGVQAKVLLSDWEQSALAAASIAPANYFSREDWRPSVRNEDKKTGRGPGPTVPTLYRRAVPKQVECTHPNSISQRDNSADGDGASNQVRHPTPPTAGQRHNRAKPAGRHAGYASTRVATIPELRQSETLHARRARLTKQQVTANTISAPQHHARWRNLSSTARMSVRVAAKSKLLEEERVKKRRDLIRRFFAPRSISTALQRRVQDVARARRGNDVNHTNGSREDQKMELELQAVSSTVAKFSPRAPRISRAALDAAYKKLCVDAMSSTKDDKKQVQTLSGSSALRILQILNRTREKIER